MEWVAISSSRGSSQPRDYTRVSCIAGGFFIAEPPGKPVLTLCFHVCIYMYMLYLEDKAWTLLLHAVLSIAFHLIIERDAFLLLLLVNVLPNIKCMTLSYSTLLKGHIILIYSSQIK